MYSNVRSVRENERDQKIFVYNFWALAESLRSFTLSDIPIVKRLSVCSRGGLGRKTLPALIHSLYGSEPADRRDR